MYNKLLIIILIISYSSLSAQKERVRIMGKVFNKSLPIENIHIININSNSGVISNQNGEFIISVKINDTLFLSGIQFHTRQILITKTLIKNKVINVELLTNIVKLEEVEVRTHNFIGFLHIDANDVIDLDSIVSKEALDFSNLGFNDPTSPYYIYNPKGNFLSLLNDLNIGVKRRRRKREEQLYKKKAKNAPEKIRFEMGDIFFTKTLKIPEEYIIPYINYCNSKKVIDFYIKGRKLELIDVLVKQSKQYRELKKMK